MEPGGVPAEGEAATTETVDLTVSDALKVSITDALNEQDVVKYTVKTKTTLDKFQKKELEVIRQHEEFLWLHSQYMSSGKYDGLLIPPAPPKPDFSLSHGKLAKLQAEGQAGMPHEEMQKLKQEIQSEYLAAFQKTVAMHEVFLIRLALHPTMRDDTNLQMFLEFSGNVTTQKQKAAKGWFSSMMTAVTADPLIKHVEAEEFWGKQKDFTLAYQTKVQAAFACANNKVVKRKAMVTNLQRFATQLGHLGNIVTNHYTMSEIMRKCASSNGTFVTVEKKLSAKEDLKMTDLLRYYTMDTLAARELLTRRVKALNDKVAADKALLAAKTKGKKIVESQEVATISDKKVEMIQDTGKDELATFKKRRAAAFRKGIIQYTQCQIRQSRESLALWKQTLAAVKDMVR
jgi:sorting nexin-5/6/32